MLDDKPLQELEVGFRELDVAPQQRVDGVWAERKGRDALVQLADGDGRVVAGFGDRLDEVPVAARDPTDAQAGERVGFAEGAGGEGVGVAWSLS